MKKAFTLAEVLIALSVIGIVAALTIPSLVQLHRKLVVETKLKKAYNTISNAIKLSENDNGPMSTWPQKEQLNVYEFWDVYLNPYLNGARICVNQEACGYKTIMDYIKWSGTGNWILFTGSSRLLFKLNDGTVVFMPLFTTDYNGNIVYQESLFIDINGAQFPNEAGRDVFYFYRDYTNSRITAIKGNCAVKRMYCTYEIMSNGWKIPVDYPVKL